MRSLPSTTGAPRSSQDVTQRLLETCCTMVAVFRRGKQLMVVPIKVVKPCILLSNPNKTTSLGCFIFLLGWGSLRKLYTSHFIRDTRRSVETCRENESVLDQLILLDATPMLLNSRFLSVGHPHVMTFIPGLHVFCLPKFFSKGFPLTTPHKKTLPK